MVDNSYIPEDQTSAADKQSACPNCDGVEWVCENHTDKPWGGMSDAVNSCDCGAGAPCPKCNENGWRQYKPIDDKRSANGEAYVIETIAQLAAVHNSLSDEDGERLLHEVCQGIRMNKHIAGIVGTAVTIDRVHWFNDNAKHYTFQIDQRVSAPKAEPSDAAQ